MDVPTMALETSHQWGLGLKRETSAETGGEDTTVPLPNVSAKILSKVMEYCKFHVAARSKTEDDKPSKTDEEVSTWDKDFVKVDQATLFELILVRSAPCWQRHAYATHAQATPIKLILLLLDSIM